VAGGRYKFVKVNEHPDTVERQEFYKFAQGEQAYLVEFDRPEHVPRESQHQYTLSFETYPDFLDMRRNYVIGTEGLDLPEDVMDIEKAKAEMKKRSEGEKLFFGTAPGMLVEDMFAMLFPGGSTNPWFDVATMLGGLVLGVLDEDNQIYFFDGKKASPQLMDMCKKMLSAAGIDDVSDEQINEFFLKHGRVSAPPWLTFAYSRAVYTFLFMTGGADFNSTSPQLKGMHETWDAAPEGAEKNKLQQKYFEARGLHVMHVFAAIFARLYPNGRKVDMGNTGVFEKIRNAFSPSRTVSPDPVTDGDIEVVREYLSPAYTVVRRPVHGQ